VLGEEVLQGLAFRNIASTKCFQDQATEAASQNIFKKIELDAGENLQNSDFLRPELD